MNAQFINVWYAIKIKLNSDRDDLIEELIKPQDEACTAKLRGKIEMIDEIIERYPRELSERDDDEFADGE